MGLTHFDENGKAVMVDVTDKKETAREAVAEGKIRPIALPVLQAMVESTIQKFFADSILVEHGISYEDALHEMIQIIIHGIRVEK